MMEIELDTWEIPGDSRDVYWGDGLRLRPKPNGPSMFLRFYEWNVFGFAREGLHTRGDKEQAYLVACHHNGTAGEVTYPAHGIDLFANAGDGLVELELHVENRTSRDWGPEAGLIPCLNPGRDQTNEPITPGLADTKQTNTYFFGEEGYENLSDVRYYWHADYSDRVSGWRPADGFPLNDSPWNEEASIETTEALLVRESADGEWVTGIAWEAGMSVDAHNGWKCMHLGIPVGPLAAAERTELRGAVYLQRGDREDLLERYRDDFK